MATTTYFYTKLWENSGIHMVRTSDKPGRGGTLLVQGTRPGSSYCIHLGNDAFLTIEEAWADVAKRYASAVKSAERKLAKLLAIDPTKIVPIEDPVEEI